ncbi:MAG TPA: DUF5667 domain-containing protein, partial [Candidatus Angelobacter sp.]|nr:DUF5667 domain-containing protein [Candidatus Angelobacter sp.]
MINKTKWGFATMTALTLMFSQGAGAVTQAFAADGTTAAQTQNATTTNTGSAINTASGTTTASTDTTTQQKAGLLPDNFFYFVKIMVEKINLAFTSNDTEKAKLLSKYTAERIAEANALIKKGETDKAAETLQTAIDQQDQAISLTNGTSTTTSDSATATTDQTSGTATGSDETATTDQTSGTTTGSDETATTTDQTSGTTTGSDEAATTTDQTSGTTTGSDQTATTTDQ